MVVNFGIGFTGGRGSVEEKRGRMESGQRRKRATEQLKIIVNCDIYVSKNIRLSDECITLINEG